MSLTYEWIDGGREPTQKPNYTYPHGVDLDVSRGKTKTCSMNLPYPAPRIGYYLVTCDECGQRALITTAGRADDPRSVKLGCKDDDDRDQGPDIGIPTKAEPR